LRDKIKKNIFISIFISIIIYLALAFYGNFNLVLSSLTSFKWQYFPLILAIIYISFLLKFIKWQYYLRLIKVDIKTSDSFQIFMSTLTMSVTPGKIGELIKPYMVKDITGTPTSKTIPILFAERVTEFLALIFLVLLGVDLLNEGILIPILSFGILLLIILLIVNKTISNWIISKISKVNYLKKYIDPLSISLINSRIALKPKPFILMFLLSVIIWVIESFGFYLVLIKFNISLSVIWSFFTYLFSVFIGSISFLPAGLGITDGSISILLSNIGVSKEISVSSALIIRIATLWFALFIGLLSMLGYNKLLNKTLKNKK
jgi:glycosyltransferase 2 family protein